MQTRTAKEANVKVGPNLEETTYEAELTKVTCWVANKYKSNDIEPSFTFWWNLGDVEGNGQEVTRRDTFINVNLDEDGFPYLRKTGRLYNRLCALYGSTFDADSTAWDFTLPGDWDSEDPAVLLELPHVDEGKQEGFLPIELKSLRVNGQEMIGRLAMVKLVKKGDYFNVESASPVPRRRGVAAQPAAQQPAAAAVPARQAQPAQRPNRAPAQEDLPPADDNLPFEDGQEDEAPPPAPPARGGRQAGSRF
jgi:hypothetical protein